MSFLSLNYRIDMNEKVKWQREKNTKKRLCNDKESDRIVKESEIRGNGKKRKAEGN